MKTKNQIIALATSLFLLGSATCYALSPIYKDASTAKQKISVNTDTILRTAYPKTLTKAMAYQEPKELDDYFKNLPPIQLEKDVLGFIHPTIQFNNAQGEERYLVIIEKVNIYDGYVQGCRACSSTADLLLYKIQNGQFVLINSAKNQDQIPSADGHFTLKLKEQLNKNLQAFGKNMMGSYAKATFSGSGGHEESHWYAVLLPDTGKIQAIEVGYAGGSNSSYFADRPHLASSTSSTLKVIANGADYYPIEVTYTDKGNKKPYKSKFTYNAKKSEYVETKVK